MHKICVVFVFALCLCSLINFGIILMHAYRNALRRVTTRYDAMRIATRLCWFSYCINYLFLCYCL